jgi:MFS superfamily sulfate permease-like transporter
MHLWKIDKIDFTVWMSAFLGVTFLGVEIGLIVSVLTSFIFVLWESVFPIIAILCQLPDSNFYRDMVQYPESIQHEGILIVQVNSPIYFMNADNIRLKILMQEKEASDNLSLRNGGCIKFVIMNMSSISRVDSYGLRMLNELVRLMRMKNICIMFVNPHLHVIDKISSSICIDENGSGTIFVSISDAVTWCLDNWGIATSVLSETIEEMENATRKMTSVETNGF